MENIRRGGNTNIQIMYLLDNYRKSHKMSIPGARASISNQLQAQDEFLKLLEQTVLPSLNEAMHILDISSADKELFKDFIEFRDLTKDLINALKRAIEANRSLVEIFDKMLYWANKKL